jgi:hypothetical protein
MLIQFVVQCCCAHRPTMSQTLCELLSASLGDEPAAELQLGQLPKAGESNDINTAINKYKPARESLIRPRIAQRKTILAIQHKAEMAGTTEARQRAVEAMMTGNAIRSSVANTPMACPVPGIRLDEFVATANMDALCRVAKGLAERPAIVNVKVGVTEDLPWMLCRCEGKWGSGTMCSYHNEGYSDMWALAAQTSHAAGFMEQRLVGTLRHITPKLRNVKSGNEGSVKHGEPMFL